MRDTVNCESRTKAVQRWTVYPDRSGGYKMHTVRMTGTSDETVNLRV